MESRTGGQADRRTVPARGEFSDSTRGIVIHAAREKEQSGIYGFTVPDYPPVRLSGCPAVRLSVCPPVRMSVCPPRFS
jgi:hypothetical protein